MGEKIALLVAIIGSAGIVLGGLLVKVLDIISLRARRRSEAEAAVRTAKVGVIGAVRVAEIDARAVFEKHLMEQVNGLSGQLDVLRGEVKASEATYHEAKAQFAESLRDLRQTIADLEKTIAERDRQIEELYEQRQADAKAIAELKTEIAELKAMLKQPPQQPPTRD